MTHQRLWQVLELLAKEKRWGWWRTRCETQRATQLLGTFHASPLPPDDRGDRWACPLNSETDWMVRPVYLDRQIVSWLTGFRNGCSSSESPCVA